MDFEILLSAASAEHRRPCLVEIGRAITDGHPASTTYVWSTGRIIATVGSGWARIRRRRGTVMTVGRSNELRLTRDELGALDAACADWARRRDDWTAFYTSSVGYPPGYGASYYRAAGKNGERVTLGRFGPGMPRGDELYGHDEVVLVPDPHEGSAFRVIAEIRGPLDQNGSAARALVGLRYRLDDDLFFDARRMDAQVHRQDCEVELEPGEEEFLQALVAVVR